MEIKVILEAGDSLKELFAKLGVVAPAQKSTTQKPESQKEVVKEVKKEETKEPKKDIDYEALRSEIKRVGSELKAQGVEVKTVLSRYGGKLSAVADEALTSLLQDLKDLHE